MRAFTVKLPSLVRYWTVVDAGHRVVRVADFRGTARMFTAKDGNALHEAGLLTGFTAARLG